MGILEDPALQKVLPIFWRGATPTNATVQPGVTPELYPFLFQFDSVCASFRFVI